MTTQRQFSTTNGRGEAVTTTQAPTDFERLMQQPNQERAIAFVPYGASDQIKLSVKVVQNLIAVRTKSGKTCSDRDAIRFMMMCQAQRLNPFAGDAFLVGYDGKDGPSFSLITAHQAFLKRAELHPEYDGMESGIIILNEDGSITETEGDFHLKDQQIIGGWARVHFKNRKLPCYRRIRLARFNNGFAQWGVDPAGMICKCAEADALRSSFPTMLGGLFLRDEVDLNVATSVPIEVTQNQLVEVRGAPHRTDSAPAPADDEDGDLGPQKPAAESKPPAAEPLATVQTNLAKEITEAGFNITEFSRAMEESGTIPNCTSYATFEEIPTEACKRVLTSLRGQRSRPTIINALTIAKGQLV